jgi:hypothetical protein
MNNEHLNRY